MSDTKSSSPERIHAENIEKPNIAETGNEAGFEELDRRITRKFDVHIVPWLFGLWMMAFIDRANIGNARIDGMTEDLHLTGSGASNQFNIALAIFYVPYIVWDIPSNLVLKKLRAGIYLPALVVIWGFISLCIGFVKNSHGLYALRFLLGWAEGGLLGGMIIYLAMFYRRHQMLVRIGLFYCAAPLSGAFGGLLATGLAKISTPGYDGWPFIFFVEGAITVIVGTVTMFFLPHTPSQAKFLTLEERERALSRMQLDSHGTKASSTVDEEKFDWFWVRRALFHGQTLVLSGVFFAIITPIYSFSLFLPTIVRDLGYTATNAQLLTVPPNMAGFVTVLIVAWLSDKYKMRGYLMLIGEALAVIGYIMLIASPRPLIRYGGTFFVAAGIFPCSPLVMGWLANNLEPHYVRATGTGFQIMIANCAAFIATFAYLPEDGPRYIVGHAINLGTLGLALVLTVLNIACILIENKKRIYGKKDYLLEEYAEREDRLGDKHPRFMYTM